MIEWKPIKNFEGRYEVSNTGLVRSLKGRWGKGKILTPNKNTKGYLSVELCGRTATGEYMSKGLLVHILVADAFLREDPSKPVIDHINCDRQDNRVENLKRCTYTENNHNPITLARKEQGINRACKTDAFRAKCSVAANARKCRVLCVETGIVYESYVAAAKATGRNPATIQESCKRARSGKIKQIHNGRPVLHFVALTVKPTKETING